MVYIVQSKQSEKNYDNWLCGGSIISPIKIITAAGCLVEMKNVYVIAGYRKYVSGRGVDTDDCTRTRKNRVVKTCVPKDYKSNWGNGTWAVLNIGVGVVERPFNFKDGTWKLYCSYVPKPIRISYDGDLIQEKADVVAFGWGGAYWRSETDVLDNNSPYLQEISCLIVAKHECTKDGTFHKTDITSFIDEYMLCVKDNGNFDGGGNIIYEGHTAETPPCRRSANGGGCDMNIDADKSRLSSRLKSMLNQPVPSRRAKSLCQNDNGGPLIAWAGSEEVLIGVASMGLVSDQRTMSCIGPSLFTSTFCVGKVIACLITGSGSDGRKRCSAELKEEGVYIQEIEIDWKNQ